MVYGQRVFAGLHVTSATRLTGTRFHPLTLTRIPDTDMFVFLLSVYCACGGRYCVYEPIYL